MTRALDVVATLILEDGRTWLDAATDAQISDMRAWLEDGRVLHFATRARGYAKTQDVAALCLATLVIDPSARVDWLAADRDQGTLAIDSILGFVRRTPGLAAQVMITAFKVTTIAGAQLEVLAADAASAFGRRTSLMVLDEFANWADTEGTRRLYYAMRSTLPKTAASRLVIITNSGSPSHFSYAELERARVSSMWRTSELPGPAPWMDPARLAEERAALPQGVYAQLFQNEWVEAVGDFLDPAVLAAAFTLPGPAFEPAPGYYYAYHAALDVGIVNDATVLSIGHRDGDRIVLDLQRVWQGSRTHPVDLAAVGEEVFECCRAFDGARLIFDPYQALELAGRLEARGVLTTPFHFSAQSKMRLASALLTAFNTGSLSLYDAPGLRAELAALRVVSKDAGMWAFDHRPGQHDDRSVSLAMMLLAATLADDPGVAFTVVYRADAFASEPMIRRDDLVLTGERYQDETGALDGDGEPIRQPPSGWTLLDASPYTRGQHE